MVKIDLLKEVSQILYLFLRELGCDECCCKFFNLNLFIGTLENLEKEAILPKFILSGPLLPSFKIQGSLNI